MKKFHNKPVNVSLNHDEIWTMLKVFREEFADLTPELEERFILAYHAANLANVKADTADFYEKSPIDIEEALEVAESCELTETAINAAWLEYLNKINTNSSIKYYEPVPYPDFARVLETFWNHYDNTPRLKEIADGLETLPFEIKPADWEGENFERGLEEMKELYAGLQAEEIKEATLPIAYRVEAVNLSIRAIQEVKEAFAAESVAQAESPSNIVQIEPSGRAMFQTIRRRVVELINDFEQGLSQLHQDNDLETPIGDTVQEGKVKGATAVLNMLDQMQIEP